MEVVGVLRRGRKGSARLRLVAESYIPELAKAASDSEELLLLLLGERCMPMPEVNEWVCGYKVDCVWREQRVIVEVDSEGFHSIPSPSPRTSPAT